MFISKSTPFTPRLWLFDEPSILQIYYFSHAHTYITMSSIWNNTDAALNIFSDNTDRTFLFKLLYSESMKIK